MIKYHYDIAQRTDEWYAARCGLLTSSEMERIITAKRLEFARNDSSRGHLYELAAQRISGFVEPHYRSDDMLRGDADELDAKILYNEKYAPVTDCGFITNDSFGFKLGYSPDGLIGSDFEGQIEVKGRRQKFQVETITKLDMPAEFAIQVQTGLLVSGRSWCDFISYCGGLPMVVLRVHPDEKMQAAITQAAKLFHEELDQIVDTYWERLLDKKNRLIRTQRRIEQEITI